MERFTSQAKEALRLAKEAAIELEYGTYTAGTCKRRQRSGCQSSYG